MYYRYRVLVLILLILPFMFSCGGVKKTAEPAAASSVAETVAVPTVTMSPAGPVSSSPGASAESGEAKDNAIDGDDEKLAGEGKEIADDRGTDATEFPEPSSDLVLAGKKLREQEKALKDIDRAIKFRPGVAISYRIRGAIFCEMKKYDRALADFKKASGIKPGDLEMMKSISPGEIDLDLYRAQKTYK